ncbi:hypothetical protein OG21DRAFT_922733 [Imleria badia]|nr:hypothetical protein OG21DRAFT_922733 [Imleria badia]
MMDPESNENGTSSEVKTIKIDGRGDIWSVAFLDGMHIVSGGAERKMRRWRAEDGKEVETRIMHAASTVRNIAVSPDGQWIVSGTSRGAVLWNAKTRETVAEFQGKAQASVCAVDFSPGSRRIATGSEDGSLRLWSFDGKQVLETWQHDYPVVGVKFSPAGGRFIAAATQWGYNSVRIYDSWNAHLLVDFPVRVNSIRNQSLVWASDNTQLLALSSNGDINCLDVSSGTTLSKWRIHSSRNPTCIALASNGAFIAASDDFSVSFWDTTTHKQIGSVIQHTDIVVSMSISANYDIVIGGGQTITLWSLRGILPSSYCNDIPRKPETWHTQVENADQEEPREALPQIQVDDPKEKIVDLEKTVQELRNQLADSQLAANEEKDRLSEIIKSFGEKDESSNSKIAHLEKTVEQLHAQLVSSESTADNLAQILGVHERKHHCEALYSEGRIIDAAESLIEIANAVSEEVRTNKLLMDWLAGEFRYRTSEESTRSLSTDFTHRCISTLELTGDEASNVEKYEEALTAYATALSLSPSTPNAVLIKWARIILIHGTVNEALGITTKFQLPRFGIYQTICDILEGDGHISEAVECFRRMRSELSTDTTIYDERAQWELGFQRRCTIKLGKLGDAAMDSGNHGEAAKHFSTILLLDPVNRLDVLIKRSKARTSMNLWGDALSDADEAIELNPSCHRGYEMRHAILHGARRHAEAVEAFHIMLLKLEESPDERIRELRCQYVDATLTIRRTVEQTIRHMPRVLIDTATGRLYDKKQQAEAFEALPIYSELVSSMTTKLDYALIWRTVKEFYRYVMFSHRWEYDEPLLQKVENISIYELEASQANIKLQRFCSLARSLGFQWAWSDTCCVDKLNNVVLQESLVAMFTWYRGSSLTVVYLRGVSSESRLPGGIKGSIWNTRAWTYQEYVAAETVQFYTEDWKPYLGLDKFNHKESPVIISEMQQATGGSVQDITVLRPGLDRVREKLYLASMRQTTLVEDIAYSLLGIFNAAIPVIYGEGNRAVGRFLEHILTGSGDVTILAWTGHAGDYNSCLPPDLTVYSQLVPPHVPQPIETAEMDSVVTAFRSSLSDLSAVVTLQDHLNKLPSPSFTASRLSLPGIVFSITELDDTLGSGSETDVRPYRAMTSELGEVEIKTRDDLARMKDLLLIHPWISPLLDQEFSDGASALDDTSRALRLVARLRQPFGALLLEPLSHARYRRVAADSLIMVQVREETLLSELMDGIRTVDIQ